jgi:hypothetical protein
MDINKQIELVLKKFPKLTYCTSDKVFTGELFISSSDSYEVRISLNNFPKSFPDVWEVGERIPRKVDRHIYESTGRCCLTTAAREQIMLKTKVKNLQDFINYLLIPFFQNNSYYEIIDEYKEGEYSHGEKGIMEAYRDILNLNNIFGINEILENLLNNPLTRKQPCYCGSDVSLRNCKQGKHLQSYKEFNLIDKNIVSSDLYKLINPYIREIGLYSKFFGMKK